MLIEGLSISRVTITAACADRIIATARDAGSVNGIGYWAEWHPTKADVIREHNDSDITADKGPWITLSRSKLARGCALALADGHNLRDTRFDGPVSDLIIQFAAFGEEKYG